MSKERPILFSGPMVWAILDGRKTMTRRVLKPQPVNTDVKFPCGEGTFTDCSWHHGEFLRWGDFPALAKASLKIQCGDLLLVREAYRATKTYDGCKPSLLPQSTPIHYEADYKPYLETQSWGNLRPSIFMPRWASRITLRVTAVKVERLQNISRGDAMEEGCPFPNMAGNTGDPRLWFAELWESINGPGSWDANPWVAAYSFERVK